MWSLAQQNNLVDTWPMLEHCSFQFYLFFLAFICLIGLILFNVLLKLQENETQFVKWYLISSICNFYILFNLF